MHAATAEYTKRRYEVAGGTFGSVVMEGDEMESRIAGGALAADWYPDPAGQHEFRYWDGAAWTDNVADRGQASVDPVETPSASSLDNPVERAVPNAQVAGASPATGASQVTAPLPMSAQVPVVPAEPEPGRRGARRPVILAAVLLLAVVLVAGGCSLLNGSLAVKNAAAESIAAAKVAIAAADPAVEPGSQELTESQKSKAALDEASMLLVEGSVFQQGPYRDAKTKADQARRIAVGITDRVAALASEAASATGDDAIAQYFALYQKYPRTRQGQGAIASAAGVLLEGLGGGSDIGDLDSIDTFCTTCPGDVPSSVVAAAAASIKSIAGDSLGWQEPMVTSNKSWVKKLRGKGANFTISGATASDTNDLTHVIGMLSDVQGTSFEPVMTLLRDSSKLGERCSKIARSPLRKRGSVSYFSSGQISQIDSLSKQMGAKLDEARGLLNDL
jgi:hypothetical protein